MISRACVPISRRTGFAFSLQTSRSLHTSGSTCANLLSSQKITHVPISSITGTSQVAIDWNDSTRDRSKFHSIWLRDHCRCSECFHPVTKQRLLNTFEIDPTIRPTSVESSSDALKLTWPDSHVSLYPWDWLQSNSYDPPVKEHAASPKKTLWTSSIASAPPTVPYEAVMADEGTGLLEWLENVDRYGFSFVSGVPATPEATEELGRRIAFIRETHYGQFWDFTADLAKGDTAYTNLALGAHTDNTYFTDPCGLQLFHLLSHTDGSGGATLLVDGFQVAHALKSTDRDAYDLLASVQITAHAAGDPDSIFRATSPLLVADPATGELSRVRYNNDDRSALRTIRPEMVEKWYGALKKWQKILTSQESEYWIQLQPGTAVVLNNHRVLHGRSGFSGKRRMCGAYFGMDEFQSKLAVLRERHSPSKLTSDRGIWAPSF